MKHTRLVETITAAASPGAAESGKFYIVGGNDLVATLPAAEAGLHFRFAIASVGGSTGFTLDPAAGESLNGAGAGVGIVNTQATAAIGDAVEVWSDGSGWFTTSKIGIWA